MCLSWLDFRKKDWNWVGAVVSFSKKLKSEFTVLVLNHSEHEEVAVTVAGVSLLPCGLLWISE